MSDYSVPKIIRDKRPPGTTVKRQKNRYYVYEYSSTSKKVENGDGTFRWKSTTKMGRCIGRITEEDGFIPNDDSLRTSDVTVLEFGGYFLLNSCSGLTFDLLKKAFNADDARHIYAVAAIFVVEGFTYMDDLGMRYQESVLRYYCPSLKMGRDAIRTLYRNLGRKGGLADRFEQHLIDCSSGTVAIDGHVIACAAVGSDLSAYGYKSKKIGREQVNWLAAYDVGTGKPLASQMFNGAEPDKISVQTMFSRFQFKNTLFLVDRGFNTEPVKELMTENGCSYITPMVAGRKDYEWVYAKIRFDKRRSFVYDKHGYSSLVYYQDIQSEDGKRYLAFCDTTRQAAERAAYIKKIGDGMKGYSDKGLVESEKDFGLFLLETNDLIKKPQEVFSHYKSRWQIETFYDYIDNSIDFNALCQKEYYSMQGLGFIMQIAGMIFHDIKDNVEAHGLPYKNTMSLIKGLKLVRERNRWMVRNVNKERRSLCDKLGVPLPSSVDLD